MVLQMLGGQAVTLQLVRDPGHVLIHPLARGRRLHRAVRLRAFAKDGVRQAGGERGGQNHDGGPESHLEASVSPTP